MVKSCTFSGLTNYAQSSDNFIATTSISNTGCDTRRFPYEGWNMNVVVWDASGDSILFIWRSDGGDGSLIIATSNANDPDVVVGPNGTTVNTMIVYEIDNNVYYEVWEYELVSNTWSNTISTRVISDSDYDKSNPNIDVDLDGNVVVVWEENDDIMAATGTITGGLSTVETVYSTDVNSVPDVCIHTNDNGTNVGFTYLNFDGTNYFLFQQDEDFNDVVNGTMTQNPISLKGADPANNEEFGRPRIAAPINEGYCQLGDHEIVVNFTKYIGFVPYCEIYGYNTYAGNSTWDTINSHYDASYNPTTLPNLTTEQNFEPVVTYTEEQPFILVAWTYYNSVPKYSSSTYYDIMVRQLDYDGSFKTMGSSPALPYYSIANNTLSGIQKTVSISDRFSSGGVPMLCVYNDITTGSVSRLAYKYCNAQSPQLRKKNPELINIDNDSPFQYSMYPNPNSSGNLFIDLNNIDSQTKVLIFDSQGKKITDKKLYAESSVIDLKGLSSGLYIVKLFANNEIFTEKISVIK